MPVVAVVGAQWGDEGKGKVVDLYAESAEVTVRYGGGANAGHTLVVEDDKVVLHLLPSGALHADKKLMLGQGMVLDPEVLTTELDELGRRGLLTPGRLMISERAHLVLPHHFEIDGRREDAGGGIGTTRRGIGPAYQDKAARRGIRAGDILRPDSLGDRLEKNLAAWKPILTELGCRSFDIKTVMDHCLNYAERLGPYIGDVSGALTSAIADGANVLLEGAQGTMLDIDYGTYPFVTSSSVTAAGVASGAGIPPTAVNRVIGITKAYTTRVGGGPMPTEMRGEDGDRLRQAGAEFGATTGRPRRCGWLDLPVLRYAVRINGMTQLALTKLDVLKGLGPIQVCVAYDVDGKRLEEPPFEGLERAKPILVEVPGFDEDLAGARSMGDLPEAARSYLSMIESEVGCPIGLLSVGPGRHQSLLLADPFA